MSKHNALTTFGRTGNPMFRGEAFKPDATFADSGTAGRMTLAGTVNKTGILLVLCGVEYLKDMANPIANKQHC